MGKEILCDSSSLISITDSCIAHTFPFIVKQFNLSLIITDTIEQECITKPMNIATKQYMFSAIRIKNALEKGLLVKVKASPAITKKRDEILNLANNIFFAQGRPFNLIHPGEAEMLALASDLQIKHILMDERTTRLLIEAPFQIKEHFEEEFHTTVMVSRENLDKFKDLVKGMSVFRSTEFLTLAYQHGYFDDYGKLKKDAYSSALYRLKYAGCSIRYDEIEELLKTA